MGAHLMCLLITIPLLIFSPQPNWMQWGNRWVASLGPYHFNLHYKPGKLNSDADALSRIDWRSVMAEEVKATMDLAQVDRTVIVEPSVFEDTLENVPILKRYKLKVSLKSGSKDKNRTLKSGP